MTPTKGCVQRGQALPEYLILTVLMLAAGLYLATPISEGSAVTLLQAAFSQTWVRLALSLAMPG